MMPRHSAPAAGRCLGVLFLLMATWSPVGVQSIGINYGMVADNLPDPTAVVKLLKTTSVQKVKLYEANATILSAFANSGFDLIIGVENALISPLAASQTMASQWVATHVQAFYPATKIVLISVGNEILTSSPTMAGDLVAAMEQIQSALTNASLTDIKVSTPHSFAVISASTPPSEGIFQAEYASSVFTPLLSFLAKTGSPFMINAYPFFAFSDMSSSPLPYALFEQNSGVYDNGTGLTYQNLFDAQIDATYCAMGKLGFYNVTAIVSETGWPSQGDDTQSAATMSNAQTYNSNLLKHIEAKSGTPLKPNVEIDTFIFALFNENLKPGPLTERNFGLFWPSEKMVYDVGIQTGAYVSPSPTSGPVSPVPASSPTAPTVPSPQSAAAPPPQSVATPSIAPAAPVPALPPPPPSPPSPPPPPYPVSQANSPQTTTAPAPAVVGSPPVVATPPPVPVVTPPVASVIPPPPAPVVTPPPVASPPPNVTAPPPPVPAAAPPPNVTTVPPPPVVSPPAPVAPIYPPPPVTPPPPPSFFTPPPGATPPPPVTTTPPPLAPPVAPLTPPPPVLASPPPPVVSSPLPPVTVTPPPLAPPVVAPPPPVVASPPPPVVSPPPPVVIASPPPPAASPPPYPPTSPSPPPPEVVPPTPSVPSVPPPAPVVPVVPAVPPAAGAPPVVPVPPVTEGPPPAPPNTPSGPNTWCVAKPGMVPTDLQAALNYACGEGGADCSLIQTGQPCFTPDTLFSHASFAFNSYYAANGRNYWNCFFGNSSLITITNPSYPGCAYP